MKAVSQPKSLFWIDLRNIILLPPIINLVDFSGIVAKAESNDIDCRALAHAPQGDPRNGKRGKTWKKQLITLMSETSHPLTVGLIICRVSRIQGCARVVLLYIDYSDIVSLYASICFGWQMQGNLSTYWHTVCVDGACMSCLIHAACAQRWKRRRMMMGIMKIETTCCWK